MKKVIYLICLFWTAQYVHAATETPNSQNVQRYVLAKVALMQADLQHLQAVVDVLAGNDPSKAAAYQQVGSGLLKSFQSAASGQGFTLASYYAFGEANKDAVDAWLAKNRALSSQLDQLAHDIEMLKAQNTNIVTVPAASDSGDQP